MKKTTVIIALALCLSLSSAYADSQINILVNGNVLKLDQNPYVKNGRTLVPVRAVADAFNLDIQWVADTRQVIIRKNDGNRIVIGIDQQNAELDGKPVSLEVPAQLSNGRAMVPMRFIAEALGAKIDWDSINKFVLITTGPVVEKVPFGFIINEKLCQLKNLSSYNIIYPAEWGRPRFEKNAPVKVVYFNDGNIKISSTTEVFDYKNTNVYLESLGIPASLRKEIKISNADSSFSISKSNDKAYSRKIVSLIADKSLVFEINVKDSSKENVKKVLGKFEEMLKTIEFLGGFG